MMTFTNDGATMVQNYDLDNALASLRAGGLILFPTDTVWCVGCDASNQVAIERLRQLRQLPADAALEVLVSSLDMLRSHVQHLHPRLETLLIYHVRPLTVIYDKGRNLPKEALSKEGRIAIRLVQDNYCRDLVDLLGSPIAAVEADKRNGFFPLNFGSISSDVIEEVDYVSKYRRRETVAGQPSVMVKLSRKDELVFLRE
ncbi:MAG TPA: Sua5/YciO/YrdC/YwlC family protein [Saprospiraceae bacterium]|nr:Sua5/YciO/YrdC/YwlC family protein [Saprospiraceae bacterium]HMQ85202.1 Sua5/YciO/YrdC/YwlC family protein [Saprospiraceae bacterium]